MDFRTIRCVLHLLTISSLLCSLSRAESSGSVFFVDDQCRRYIRSPSQDDVAQSHSISLLEVGAAVSVLLGVVPPATLSAAGSAKLNEVLVPDPFNRPRAVFMMEVPGAEGLLGDMFSGALRNKIVGPEKAQIQLPGEEVSVIYLDEGLADPTAKEIGDFASWLGGSYAIDSSAVMNGELTLPLPSGASVNFHMSKKADREFIKSLLALFHNSRSAIEMHEALSKNNHRPAELMMGCFAGIKVLVLYFVLLC
uniref:Putative TYPE 1 MEMBRANE family protein n=1 Tax=Rhizophora mucronata TaxID=61149 RepID=A0A2P2LDC0_RHIMU